MESTRHEKRPGEADESSYLVSEQVKLLYSGLPSSIAAHLLLSVLSAFVLRGFTAWGRLAGWLGFVSLIALARGVLYLRRQAGAGGLPGAWLGRFRVGAAAGGVAWALLPLLLFPSELPHQFFVVFVISGITAGAVTSLAPDWKSALLFVVPPLLALIARLLVNAGEISVVMGIMTLAYLAFISLSGVRAFNDTRESATLREQMVANARRLSEAQRIARLGDWEIDVATGRMTWSDTVYEIFGRDPATFRPDMEKYYGELVHPDDVAAVRSEEQAAHASGRVHRIDHRAVMPDGSERSVHVEGIAEFDQDGRPLRIRGIVQDITERKHLEETLRRFNAELERLVDERTGELRQSEGRLRCVTDSLNEGLLLTDLDDVITDVNPKMLAMTGYTREELVGRSALEIFVAPEERQLMRERNRGREAGEAGEYEQRLRRKDGSTFWARIVGSPLRDMSGAEIGTVGASLDIAERKESERKLQESQSRLAGIIGSAMDAIIMVDANQNIVLFNNAAERMFGYPASEVVGRPLERLIPARLRAAHHRHLAVFGKTGITTRGMGELGTVSGLRANGEEFPIEVSISQVEIAGEKSFTAILRDITARKRAEAKLLELNEDLIRSNKELEQFAYVASHDLQEPLRMVSSYTQLLARRYGDKLDQEAREFIHYAVDGANRMQHLIQDLLSYSRVATSEKQVADAVDLRTTLREAVMNIEAAIVESAAVVTDADLPTLTADHTQMVQLFQNLIGNAIKFRKHGEPPRVQISAEKSGHEWIISVKDNGIGIDPQYFLRIFAIFQRLHGKDEYPGTGIGLALCQRIVQRHGGKIWVESEPGEGSTFRFTMKGS